MNTYVLYLTFVCGISILYGYSAAVRMIPRKIFFMCVIALSLFNGLSWECFFKGIVF